MKHQTIRIAYAVFALAVGTCSLGHAQSSFAGAPAEQAERSWHSQSLTTETVTGPNGSITTPTALSVNPRMGATETKIAEPVAKGVYALRGWGIAASYAIDAPNGWTVSYTHLTLPTILLV